MAPKKYKLAQRRPEKDEFPGLPGEAAESKPAVDQNKLLAGFMAKNKLGDNKPASQHADPSTTAVLPPPPTAGGGTRAAVPRGTVFEEDDDDESTPVTPATAATAASPSSELSKQQTTDTMGSGGGGGGGLNCDLCNGEVKGGLTLEEHVAKSHPDLTAWCDRLIATKPSLGENTVNPVTALALGQKAKDLAQVLDKGKASFECAVEGTKQLTMIAQQKFRNCHVYMFGSCVALGVWDGDGDVDMTLVDPKGWMADPQTWPGDEASIVMKLTRCLRDTGFAFEDLEPVRHTRVPIVRHVSALKSEKWRLGDKRCNQVHIQLDNSKLSKQDKTTITSSIKGSTARTTEWEGNRVKVQCVDGTDAVACRTEPIIGLPQGCRERYRVLGPDPNYKPAIFYMDLDVSSRAHGVRNSYLLRGYFKQHHAFRAGSVFVKKWSKASGVNNSKKGYLTSYAVNILWLYYLIQKKHATWFDPQSIPLLPADPATELTYMPIFPSSSTEEEKNLGDLIVGFFKFYATEFDWESDVVSLNQASCKSKSGELRWTLENEVHAELFRNRIWYRLCIEDPYEPNLNLGRHVSPVKLKKLMAEFLHGYTQLLNGEVKGLLHDRSSDKVTERMQYLLKKAMVGYEERPYAEVAADFAAQDEASWAAYQVEHKNTKVFDPYFTYVLNGEPQNTGGRRRRGGGKKKAAVEKKPEEKPDADASGSDEDDEEEVAIANAKVIHVHTEETLIEAKARAAIEEVEKVLKENPTMGVALTDEWHDLFLDTLFVCDQDSDRLFLENADCEKFYNHKRVVDAVMRDEFCLPLKTLCDEAKKRWPKADLDVIDAVVRSFPIFQVTKDGLVKLNTSKVDKILGDCADCRMRKVMVWGEKPGDKLMYCAKCWADFERRK